MLRHVMNPLVPLRRLVARVKAPASRTDDLRQLRARMKQQPARRAVTRRERDMADRLRALREALSELGPVSACATCSRGMPLPQGRWDGGHCCSGDTHDVFSDDELFALTIAGTAPRHLQTPTGDQAGCAFRGERGCTLSPVDRPNVCVRYLCRDLRTELHVRGALMPVVEGIDEMEHLFGELSVLRKQRADRAELRAVHPLLVTDEPDPSR